MRSFVNNFQSLRGKQVGGAAAHLQPPSRGNLKLSKRGERRNFDGCVVVIQEKRNSMPPSSPLFISEQTSSPPPRPGATPTWKKEKRKEEKWDDDFFMWMLLLRSVTDAKYFGQRQRRKRIFFERNTTQKPESEQSSMLDITLLDAWFSVRPGQTGISMEFHLSVFPFFTVQQSPDRGKGKK